MEAPGIEPGSENLFHLRLRAYLAVYFTPCRDGQRPHHEVSHLFDLALPPVIRGSAIQFGHARRRVLADPSLGRLHSFLGCESDCVVVRN